MSHRFNFSPGQLQLMKGVELYQNKKYKDAITHLKIAADKYNIVDAYFALGACFADCAKIAKDPSNKKKLSSIAKNYFRHACDSNSEAALTFFYPKEIKKEKLTTAPTRTSSIPLRPKSL